MVYGFLPSIMVQVLIISSHLYIGVQRIVQGEKMLILTRKVGEVLVIGDEVEVTVLEVRGQQVRIGIKAPKEVSVHRSEIYNKIKSESKDDEQNN